MTQCSVFLGYEFFTKNKTIPSLIPSMAKKSKTVYSCQKCGAQRPKWEGRCTDCGAWDTFVEETFRDNTHSTKTQGWAIQKETSSSSTSLIPLNAKFEALKVNRYQTNISELDRVLGGGLVSGSFVLLGGEPGVGKSTLLMQMAGGLGKNNSHVVYISGEESVAQSGSRAQRLGVIQSNVEIGSENDLLKITDLVRKKKPNVLIIDSIQTVFLPELNSTPGTVSQIRECAGHLMTLAKSENISVILIGHVTKDGQIAGPKVLEHMVDTVLSFEGDMNYGFRLLRAIKNRFGATHELGVFQMNSEGLAEVSNPSEMFLEERGEHLIGSAVFASMEGSRPLLCEVQALSNSTPMAMPRRTAIGTDVNRLHLLIAVLGRHLKLSLNSSDIFINVVGGLKLVEPASDLAVAAALISSDNYKEIKNNTLFFGEIGLTGEVRGVSFADLRIREADKLGFDTFIIPFANKKHLKELKLPKEKSIHWIKHIKNLSQLL